MVRPEFFASARRSRAVDGVIVIEERPEPRLRSTTAESSTSMRSILFGRWAEGAERIFTFNFLLLCCVFFLLFTALLNRS